MTTPDPLTSKATKSRKSWGAIAHSTTSANAAAKTFRTFRNGIQSSQTQSLPSPAQELVDSTGAGKALASTTAAVAKPKSNAYSLNGFSGATKGPRTVGAPIVASSPLPDTLVGSGGMQGTAKVTQQPNMAKVTTQQPNIDDAMKTWAYALQEDDVAFRQGLAAWIDTVPFFAGMDAFYFESLLPVVEKRNYRRGQQVLTEGRMPEAFHIVYAGKVDIIVNDQTMQTLGPKDLVSEHTIILPEPPPLSHSAVAADTLTVTVAIRRTALMEMFRRNSGTRQVFEQLFDKVKVAHSISGLSNVELFRKADPEFAKEMESTFQQRKFEEGQAFFEAGDTTTEAYLLCRGSVKLTSREGEDEEISSTLTVDNLKQARVFGEQGLLGIKSTRLITVRALTPCMVQVMYPEAVRRVLDVYPAESWTFRQLVTSERWSNSWKLTGLATLLPSSSPKMSVLLAVKAVTKDPKKPVAENKMGNDTNAGLDVLVHIPPGLGMLPEFAGCPQAMMKRLEIFMRRRLYMPGQVLLQQGEDMSDMFVLQHGTCKAEVFGSNMRPIEAPCFIFGMVMRVCISSVVAQSTCFVATISKRSVMEVFEDYPQERRRLLAQGDMRVSELCDEFEAQLVTKTGLEQSLLQLPFMAGASAKFAEAFAKMVSPHLLVPGQEVIVASGQENEEEQSEEPASAEEGATVAAPRPMLFMLFEGYCQVLAKEKVVMSLSKKMVFGYLQLYGIGPVGNEDKMKLMPLEICKAVSITRQNLLPLLDQFPEERHRFESLVHKHLEDTVCKRIEKMPLFAHIPLEILSKIINIVERKIYMVHVNIVQEGDIGDSLVIVNQGKIELTTDGIAVGMLWPGKCFGAAQMLGMVDTYHATLHVKKTSHILHIDRKSFNTLAYQDSKRSWMSSLRQRAQAAYDSEVKVAKGIQRETCQLMRSAMMLSPEADAMMPFMRCILAVWQKIAREAKGVIRKSTTRDLTTFALGMFSRPSTEKKPCTPRHPPSRAKTVAQQYRMADDSHLVAPPIRFSRRLRSVELEPSAEGVASAQGWIYSEQSGRLDRWRGQPAPAWLAAVRRDIPNQLMALKASARGEATDSYQHRLL